MATQLQISYGALMETIRHNKEMEYETQRSNLANEEIKRETNRITEDHYVRVDAETVRHNEVVEIENNRHNIAVETETNRHNLEVEKDSDEQLQINWGHLNETARHNQAMEGLQAQANAIQQAYQNKLLLETSRHNQAMEEDTDNQAYRDATQKAAQNKLTGAQTEYYNSLTELNRNKDEQWEMESTRYPEYWDSIIKQNQGSAYRDVMNGTFNSFGQLGKMSQSQGGSSSGGYIIQDGQIIPLP